MADRRFALAMRPGASRVASITGSGVTSIKIGTSLVASLAMLVTTISPGFAQPAEDEIELSGDTPAQDPPASEPPAEAPAEAPAEPPVVKDPKVARKWLRAATTLMTKGDQLTRQGKAEEAKTNYVNAVTAYTRAIEAGDDTSLHYNIALALEKAGDLPTAMKHLNTVLAAADIKPDVLKKAQAKLDELLMAVGIVKLAITPDGTAVSLGGQPIGDAPLPEPLVLMPGNYLVTFEAVGFQPKDLELKVEAGSETERTIALDPVPIVTKPQAPEPLPEIVKPEPARPSLLPIYIGGGATLGLAMVATITGIMAVGKHGDYVDATSPVAREDARSSGKALALATDLCLVGAIGAAAFTTYWYMYRYRPEERALAERQALRSKVDVVPWVQSDAGGLSAVGSF